MIERERRFICSTLPRLNYDEHICIEQIYGDMVIKGNSAIFNDTVLEIANHSDIKLKGRGRIRRINDEYTLDIKLGSGYEREEYSFPITKTDTPTALIEADRRCIIKNRHIARGERYDTMIDEFRGRYSGVIIGELEGECRDIDIPTWACSEITDNNKLSNMNLYFSEPDSIMNYYRRMLDDCQDRLS